MKLHIDKEANALYLQLDNSEIIESDKVSPKVILDFNTSNQMVDIEMLNLSKRTPLLNTKNFELETA